MTSLDDLTKDELLELARDRDIAGRSSMTKDELVAALTALDASPAPEVQEETTTEDERVENARLQAERENAAADLAAAGPRPPRRRGDDREPS